MFQHAQCAISVLEFSLAVLSKCQSTVEIPLYVTSLAWFGQVWLENYGWRSMVPVLNGANGY